MKVALAGNVLLVGSALTLTLQGGHQWSFDLAFLFLMTLAHSVGLWASLLVSTATWPDTLSTLLWLSKLAYCGAAICRQQLPEALLTLFRRGNLGLWAFSCVDQAHARQVLPTAWVLAVASLHALLTTIMVMTHVHGTNFWGRLLVDLATLVVGPHVLLTLSHYVSTPHSSKASSKPEQAALASEGSVLQSEVQSPKISSRSTTGLPDADFTGTVYKPAIGRPLEVSVKVRTDMQLQDLSTNLGYQLRKSLDACHTPSRDLQLIGYTARYGCLHLSLHTLVTGRDEQPASWRAPGDQAMAAAVAEGQHNPDRVDISGVLPEPDAMQIAISLLPVLRQMLESMDTGNGLPAGEYARIQIDGVVVSCYYTGSGGMEGWQLHAQNQNTTSVQYASPVPQSATAPGPRLHLVVPMPAEPVGCTAAPNPSCTQHDLGGNGPLTFLVQLHGVKEGVVFQQEWVPLTHTEHDHASRRWADSIPPDAVPLSHWALTNRNPQQGPAAASGVDGGSFLGVQRVDLSSELHSGYLHATGSLSPRTGVVVGSGVSGSVMPEDFDDLDVLLAQTLGVPSLVEPQLQVLCRCGGQYLQTSVAVVSRDGPMVRLQVTAHAQPSASGGTAAWHSHHGYPGLVQPVALELWQTDTLLSTMHALATPRPLGVAPAPTDSPQLPCVRLVHWGCSQVLGHALHQVHTVNWWGSTANTTQAAATELRELAHGMWQAGSPADSQMALSHAAFVQDLCLWLDEVRRCAHSSGACLAPSWPLPLPLRDTQRHQLGAGLLRYAQQTGLQATAAWLIQQQQFLVRVLQQASPAASNPQHLWHQRAAQACGLLGRAVGLVQNAAVGYPCGMCEHGYRRWLRQYLAALQPVLSAYACGVGGSAIVTTLRAAEGRRYLWLKIPVTLLHVWVGWSHFRTSLRYKQPRRFCAMASYMLPIRVFCAAALAAHVLPMPPLLVRFLPNVAAVMAASLVLALIEQLQALVVYPASVVTVLALVHSATLVVVCCSYTSLPWGSTAVASVLSVVLGRLLLDAGLRASRLWLHDPPVPLVACSDDHSAGQARSGHTASLAASHGPDHAKTD